jgi:large subunit ribosomal protein L18
MARGPRYSVLFRRRRNGRTNFHYRKSLILSNQPRFAVRISLRNVKVQTINAELIGDTILCSAQSSELVKDFNWRGGTGNIPAAYLTGFLAGKKALQNGLSAGVLDIGVTNSIYGNRSYATLKGLVDAGIDIPHNEKVYPPEERIRGEHIANYAKYLADQETPEPPQQFNLYKKRGLNPQKFPSHFDQVKGAIDKKYA